MHGPGELGGGSCSYRHGKFTGLRVHRMGGVPTGSRQEELEGSTSLKDSHTLTAKDGGANRTIGRST